MKKQLFTEGWSLVREGSANPVPVALPHDAMLEEARREDAPSGKNGAWFEGNKYRYEKRLIPEESWQDKTLILECEGVYRKAEVWLNGEQLTFRPYGYTNFYVDLSNVLRFGEENLLVITADNSEQPNARWYSGAGINRPLWLWTGERAHILMNGIRVKTISLAPATVQVDINTAHEGEVQVELLDGSRILATAVGTQRQFTFMPSEVTLWSPDTPKLYTCRVTYGEDVAETTFGIRTLTWGKEGFFLNGQRTILKGACIHSDNGLLGAITHPDAEERKVRLLKETGYNALRSAHNPCSKYLLEACDKLGMLVMDEYIDHWYIHKNQYDYVEYFSSWWKQDLKDMVNKDYNHPSVVLYSTGNEVSETAQKRGIALTKAMTEYLHELDDSRPVTCGVNIFFNFLSSIGFGVYSDKKAQQEVDNVGKKKAVGSEFFNNLAGLLGDEFMKRGATLPPCDLKTKDAFANMDMAGYNYGIYRYGHDLKKYPNRLILGSETFCKDAYRFMEQAKKNPRLIGDFVWAGMDYLGEVGIGSWEYKEYAPDFSGGCGWVSAGSGRLDLTGKPLGEAYYTRVALEKETGPYIAVSPVCFAGEKHSPSAWKMTDALPSWSYRGCEGKRAQVEVYARAEKVELFLNGKSMGSRQKKKDCRFRFSIPYENGTLIATAYDKQGKPIGTHTLVTAGEETLLTATPEKARVQAGGLAYIRVAYQDKEGISKPMEHHRLTAQVEGGTLLAFGSGCPYQKEPFYTNETDTYYGEALAIVRADSDGQIRFSCTDGQHHTTITING